MLKHAVSYGVLELAKQGLHIMHSHRITETAWMPKDAMATRDALAS